MRVECALNAPSQCPECAPIYPECVSVVLNARCIQDAATVHSAHSKDDPNVHSPRIRPVCIQERAPLHCVCAYLHCVCANVRCIRANVRCIRAGCTLHTRGRTLHTRTSKLRMQSNYVAYARVCDVPSLRVHGARMQRRGAHPSSPSACDFLPDHTLATDAPRPLARPPSTGFPSTGSHQGRATFAPTLREGPRCSVGHKTRYACSLTDV